MLNVWLYLIRDWATVKAIPGYKKIIMRIHGHGYESKWHQRQLVIETEDKLEVNNVRTNVLLRKRYVRRYFIYRKLWVPYVKPRFLQKLLGKRLEKYQFSRIMIHSHLFQDHFELLMAYICVWIQRSFFFFLRDQTKLFFGVSETGREMAREDGE